MVKKPRHPEVPSSKKSPSGVADGDEKKWAGIYHQQAKLRKEKEEVWFVKVPWNTHKSSIHPKNIYPLGSQHVWVIPIKIGLCYIM